MTQPWKAMGQNCWAHKHREDVPLEVHHVWPTAAGGPNIAPNKVTVCSNAHSATHDLLAKMTKAGTVALPWRVRMRYGRKVRRLAVAGFRATKDRVVVAP